MGTLKPIGGFRRWVYHTLPLVYDDSLSYMELLSKLVKYCNELRQANESVSEEVQKAIDSIDELQRYVDTQFTEKMEEAIDHYFGEHDLVQTINGMSGEVTIESLPNPQKLTVLVHDPATQDEGVYTEYRYDGSAQQEVKIDLPIIPPAPVTSVNGKTGAVNIDRLPSPYALVLSYGGVQQGVYNGSEGLHLNIPAPVYPVTKVNGRTGDVHITIGDLNGVPNSDNSVSGTILLPKSTSIAKLFASASEAGKVLVVDSDGRIVPTSIGAASDTVHSVNGQFGAVVLTADDVGAIPDENGAVRLAHFANAGPDNVGKGLVVGEDGNVEYGNIGAVSRVNGKTGEVQLNAGDVGALSNQAGSVGSNNIAGGAVTGTHIADNSIGREKLNFSPSGGGGTMMRWSGTTFFPSGVAPGWRTLSVTEFDEGALLSLNLTIVSTLGAELYVRVRHRSEVDPDYKLLGVLATPKYVGSVTTKIANVNFIVEVNPNDAIYIEAAMSSTLNQGDYVTCYAEAIRH